MFGRSRFFLAVLTVVLTSASASAQQPDLSAARALGITGPVSIDQGAAIAAHHTSAPSARFIEQETEHDVIVMEYAVETATGVMEVEVRQRDGAVLEVEPAEIDDAEDEDAEDEDAEDEDG